MNMVDKDFSVRLEGGQSGTAQPAEKVLPAKIQTLGFLVARTAGLCDRISTMTSRCGVPIPVAEPSKVLTRDSQDYITELEIHLDAMDGLIQSMDNYITELERII